MLRKLFESKLKKSLKIKHLFILTTLVILIIQSCGSLKELTYSNGKFCNGKSILSFQNFNDLQSEHRRLNQRYLNGAEEDSVFVNFENERIHYSLRKKDNNIDDGLIADEPDFNPFDYTTDGILEAILNQDGIVIIGNELYMWDDGCVVVKTANSCTNYEALLSYRVLIKTYEQNPTNQNLTNLNNHRISYKIQELNACSEMKFDFETVTEEGLKAENEISNPSIRASGCGYDVFITEDFISKNPTTKKITYRLTANNFSLPGSNPLYAFYIDNITSANQVKIVTGSLPGYANNIDWYSLPPDGTNAIVYPGEWVEIEVDYSTLNSLEIRLVSSVDLFAGNSCSSTDTKVIDLTCPITISKKPLNAQNGEWQFEVEGIDISPSAYLTWRFGDGSTPYSVYGQKGAIYAYNVPCDGTEYSVSVSIENNGPMCKNPISVDGVLVGDPCKMDKRRTKWKGKIDGKRALLVIKIKDAWYNGSDRTKIKNKFRWRKSGTKKIKMSGNVYVSQGVNCVAQDLNTLINPSPGNPMTLNKKRKLKQKYKDGNHYSFDRNSPYQVEFSHTNSSFITKTLQFNVPCSN